LTQDSPPKKQHQVRNKKRRKEMEKVEIETVLNGWIVTVGCHSVVFDNKKKMLKELSGYLDDPDKVTARYTETSINRHTSQEIDNAPIGVRVPSTKLIVKKQEA